MPDKQQQPDQKKTQDNRGRSLSRRSAEQVPADALMALQNAIGNEAIGRMLGAQNKAADEASTPVDPGTQSAIDAKQGGGEALEPGMEEQLLGAAPGALDDVRIHRDPESDALTRGLGANAFTQGRDVYMRSDRGPGTEEGRETLAHELSHVTQGSVGKGAVLREPAPAGSPMAAPANTLAPPPNMLDTGGAAGQAPAGTGQPTAADPSAPPKEMKAYNLDLIYPAEYQHNPEYESHQALPEAEALKVLWKFDRRLRDSLDNGRYLLELLTKNREEHNIVGFWADTFGGVDLPDVDIFNQVGRDQLYEVEQLFKLSEEQINSQESLWQGAQKLEAQNAEAMKGTTAGMAFAMASKIPTERIERIAYLLNSAGESLADRWKQVITYKEGTEKGAETGITVCKVSIAVLSTAVGGEAFMGARAAGYGLMASSGAAGLTAGGLGMYTEAAGEVGEMIYGDREWGDFDYKKIAKVGLKDTVTGFLGALAGGKLGELAGATFAKYAAPWLAEMGVNLNNKGLQMLGGMAQTWIVGAGSTPVTTSANVLMSKAMGEKTVNNWGDFFGLMLNDMKSSVEMGTFLHAAGATAKASGGTVEPAAGEGPTSSGVPEPIGPEGDANVAPGTSNGVPEPINDGGGGSSGGGSSGATRPTPRRTLPGMGAAGPAGENALPGTTGGGIPEPLGPEADANVAPGTSNGVPEPIGPGTEATRPSGPGYEPTEPMATGVPEPLGPEADANVAPGTSNGVPEAIGPGTEPTQPDGEPTTPNTSNGVPEPVGPDGSGDVTRPNGGGGGGGGGEGSGPISEGEIGPIEALGPIQGRTTPFSETSELVRPLDRSAGNRMSVSGHQGSLPEGYGVYRARVLLETGEVVDAAIKVYPGEQQAMFLRDLAGSRAAAGTGPAPQFYGKVEIPTLSDYARTNTTDLAFAMEPVEGAFPDVGIEPGEPGYDAALAEANAAEASINEQTIQDVRNFGDAILNQGYYYGGDFAGEVQGIIGPEGRWQPIDFQGLNPLPPIDQPVARAEAIQEHQQWLEIEINQLEQMRTGEIGPDPTQPNPGGGGGGGGGGGTGGGGAGGGGAVGGGGPQTLPGMGSAGPAGPDAPPRTVSGDVLPPAPEAGAGPALGNQTMDEGTTSQTGAESQSESQSQSQSGNQGDVPEVERTGQPTEDEFDGPKDFTARRALYRTEDPFEAAQMFNQARANGRPAQVVQTNAEMQAHWYGATGQSTPAPVAFVDNFGRVIVDGTRAGEYFQGTDIAMPQGPVQNPGERVPNYAEMAPEEQYPGDVPMDPRPADAQPGDRMYPGVRGGEDRGVTVEFDDPVAAARRYYAETVAGRGVRLISGPIQNGPLAGQSYVEWVWANEYGGTGDAPAAWIDGMGFLVVNTDVVVLADNAGQLPAGPLQD